MSKITAYHVVKKGYNLDLEDAVSELIAEGWQPFGSVSYCPGTLYSTECYVQPMVKYGK